MVRLLKKWERGDTILPEIRKMRHTASLEDLHRQKVNHEKGLQSYRLKLPNPFASDVRIMQVAKRNQEYQDKLGKQEYEFTAENALKENKEIMEESGLVKNAARKLETLVRKKGEQYRKGNVEMGHLKPEQIETIQRELVRK